VIHRYSRPEMVALWTAERRFQIWLQIEVLACEARAGRGEIPQEALKVIKARAAFDVARIDEIEKEVKHDVIAFLTSVAEHVGPESRFIHLGMTSSDVLDTSFSIQLKEAAGLMGKGLDRAMAAARSLALRYQHTPQIGRSHGIHAEPITFGLKAASWYSELVRARDRLARAIEVISYGKISGAVGTYANCPPEVEQYVCAKLGLSPEAVSTQIIPRDRHAEYFAQLALIAGAIERIAVEVRHLQRTEVREAEEFFSPGQKGSSAMPHKRNPILSENLSGLARLMRGYADAAMENVALWHERDISHSSVERVIGPDATVTLDFMLHRLAGLLEGLVVYPDRMAENLAVSGGLYNSERVLLKLIDKGMSREDAYKIVQRAAMATWEKRGQFRDELRADTAVSKKLTHAEIDSLFDEEHHRAHVDGIFKRVFGNTTEIQRKKLAAPESGTVGSNEPAGNPDGRDRLKSEREATGVFDVVPGVGPAKRDKGDRPTKGRNK
jgi:adenylosuccinate lyase